MQLSIRQRLIKLDHEFYQKTGVEFGATRQAPWPGWFRLRHEIDSRLKTDYSVADLGCGNGRFLKFLELSKKPPRVYRGYDGNAYFLSEAKKILTKIKSTWIQLDLLETEASIKVEPATVMVCFGLVHHIPGFSERVDFIRSIYDRVLPGGIMAFSFWQKNQKRLKSELSFREFGIDPTQAEPGDTLMNFQNRGLPRYVHLFGHIEMENLLKTLDLPILVRYLSDGKDGGGNEYVVWQKNGGV